MLSLTAALVLGTLAILSFVLLLRSRAKKIPQGPPGIPFLGNLLQLGKFPHLKFQEWAGEYGNIYSIRMGKNRVIVLSDAQLIREAFNDPKLNGRPDVESFHIIAGGKHGIISSDGPVWTEQRRFTLRHLRDFGFGRHHMENLIMPEVNEYLGWLKSGEGKSVSIVSQFSLAVLNSLWMVIAGKRYKHDDSRLVNIFDQHTKVNVELANSPAIMFPDLAKKWPRLSGWNKLMSLVKALRSVSEEEVQEHKKYFKAEANPRDFIDAYLFEIHSTTDPNSSFYKDAGDVSLRAVIGDLFGAGAETQALTLSWSVLYLCKFPHVQKKLQKELDVVVGKNRQPSLLHRPSLPYCEATLAEVFRMSSIAPVGLFHVAMSDVKFHGFDIPEGSWVIPNLYHMHHDEEIWNEPMVFKPERHLTNNGMTFKKNDSLMPFSVGKRFIGGVDCERTRRGYCVRYGGGLLVRGSCESSTVNLGGLSMEKRNLVGQAEAAVCIGEAFARDSLFLFFANIFQRFQIRLAEESEGVTLDSKPGFLLSPQDYKVIVKDRIF